MKNGQVESNKSRSMIKKRDVIFGAVLVIIAFLMFLFFRFKPSKNTAAVVKIKGETVKVISLKSDTSETFFSNGYSVTVKTENGFVCVTDADCPDMVCKNTSAINKSGQSIVCVPAGLSITIDGSDEEGYDAKVK